jgi:hypothetical protein
MTQPVTFLDFAYLEETRRLSIATSIDSIADEPDVDASLVEMLVGRNPDTWKTFPVPTMRVRSLARLGDATWLVGKHGEVWRVKSLADIKKDQLPDSGVLGARRLGPPKLIRRIGGHLYVCGYAGQCYTLQGDRWVHMDDGLAEPQGTGTSIRLEGMHGTAPDDIYVVGSRGLLAHWDGRQWAKVPLMTDAWLAGVRCLARDNIMAVGDNGVIVHGDGQRWTVSQIPGYEQSPLADVEVFNGRVYVAAVGQLLVNTKDGGWDVVKHHLDKKIEFFRLTVGDGRLWAMGSKRISSFDGRQWDVHIDPNNA